MRQAQPFRVLTTERLELRAAQSSDGSFYHQLLSVAEVTRFSDIPDRATRAQAARFVEWMSKLFGSGSGCAWLIQNRGTLKQKAWFKGAFHDFRMFGRLAADPIENLVPG